MEIIVIKIIIIGFWLISAISFYVNYQRIINDYTAGIGKLLFYLLIIIAAPIVGLNNLLTDFMGLFMPDGWEKGDDEFYNDQKENGNDS